jgi:mono/diheme cytochrome c family protein
MEERIAIITNGKGTMTPFKDMISAAEINSLAEYIGTLRSN